MSARSHGAEGIRTARRGHERGRPPNEAAVVHELRELARGRTATVIGHRLSTVRHAEAFTAELRRDVVEVTRNSGLTQEQVAKDFGISVHSVYRWVKQADVDEGVVEGTTTAQQDELSQLRRRNRVLEQEVEILRRATAYFARDAAPK